MQGRQLDVAIKAARTKGARACALFVVLAAFADPTTREVCATEAQLMKLIWLGSESKHALDDALKRLVAAGDVIVVGEPHQHYPREYFIAAGASEDEKRRAAARNDEGEPM